MEKIKRSKEHIQAMLAGRTKKFEKLAIYKNCIVCGKKFRLPQSQGNVKCCSKECKYVQWKNDIRPKMKSRIWSEKEKLAVRKRKNIVCKQCGKLLEVTKGSIRKFCSRVCFYKFGRPEMLGEKNPNYNGGCLNNNGYWRINNKKRRYYQHQLVMEKKIGRRLKNGEIVHHIDGNKLNNNIENLILFNNASEHQKYHWGLKKRPLTGKELTRIISNN